MRYARLLNTSICDSVESQFVIVLEELCSGVVAAQCLDFHVVHKNHNITVFNTPQSMLETLLTSQIVAAQTWVRCFLYVFNGFECLKNHKCARDGAQW